MQNVEQVPINKLKKHPRNPRRGNIDAIEESIRQNGFYGVIVAQRSTGHVIVGNHRLEAAKRLGMKEVPVAWVDVDDERALRIVIADNRTSDTAINDLATLISILDQLAATDDALAGTGYTTEHLDDLIDRTSLPDDDDLASAFGKVEGGEPSSLTMTFTIPADSKSTIDAAIEHGRTHTRGKSGNANGNALAEVCRAYIEDLTA